MQMSGVLISWLFRRMRPDYAQIAIDFNQDFAFNATLECATESHQQIALRKAQGFVFVGGIGFCFE
jgi:hypothetical protein